MVSKVDQAGLILDLLQNLSLSIHHVLVFQDLLDGDYFTCRSYLGLEDFAEGAVA